MAMFLFDKKKEKSNQDLGEKIRGKLKGLCHRKSNFKKISPIDDSNFDENHNIMGSPSNAIAQRK
jgi:hypothetical protein